MEKQNDNVSEFLKFSVKYWHFLTIIFSLVVALIYHVVELKIAHRLISELTTKNLELHNEVKELDIKVKRVYDFTPPISTQKRVNDLEFRVFGRTQDVIIINERGSASYAPPSQ